MFEFLPQKHISWGENKSNTTTHNKKAPRLVFNMNLEAFRLFLTANIWLQTHFLIRVSLGCKSCIEIQSQKCMQPTTKVIYANCSVLRVFSI